MDRIKRSVAAAAGFCLFLVLILFMTAAAVYRIAGDGDLLASEMRRFAPSDVSGLPDAEYPEMGRMTAGYLTGKRPDFQYYLSDGKGNTAACFQQHEVSHMADCRRLIQWAGNLRGIMGGVALILIITAAALRKHRKSFSAGMQAGCALTGLCLLASLIWGIADFGNLFTAFHRLFFTNDGWLLDPRTDLLIRLMPTAFFVNMGIRVLLAVTAMALLAFAAARMIRRTDDKEEDQGGTGRCISGEPRVMNDGL